MLYLKVSIENKIFRVHLKVFDGEFSDLGICFQDYHNSFAKHFLFERLEILYTNESIPRLSLGEWLTAEALGDDV